MTEGDISNPVSEMRCLVMSQKQHLNHSGQGCQRAGLADAARETSELDGARRAGMEGKESDESPSRAAWFSFAF